MPSARRSSRIASRKGHRSPSTLTSRASSPRPVRTIVHEGYNLIQTLLGGIQEELDGLIEEERLSNGSLAQPSTLIDSLTNANTQANNDGWYFIFRGRGGFSGIVPGPW